MEVLYDAWLGDHHDRNACRCQNCPGAQRHRRCGAASLAPATTSERLKRSRMDTLLSQLSEPERERALEHFRIIRPFLEDGKTLTQIARDHQLPLRTLRRWAQQYRAEGLVGLGRTPRRCASNVSSASAEPL